MQAQTKRKWAFQQFCCSHQISPDDLFDFLQNPLASFNDYHPSHHTLGKHFGDQSIDCISGRSLCRRSLLSPLIHFNLYLRPMTLGFVLAIILLGLLLIFLEIFFIPGTTLFGVAGGIALVIGVIMVYSYYGARWGHIAVVSSLVLVLIAVVAGFKVIQSNKLAMNAEISGRVNELENTYKVGDKGVAATEFRPNGKGIFNGNKIEVYSTGEYIERNTPIEIIKITQDKIYIKQSKT
jgi:membrane-bound ClpP family serine protease